MYSLYIKVFSIDPILKVMFKYLSLDDINNIKTPKTKKIINKVFSIDQKTIFIYGLEDHVINWYTVGDIIIRFIKNDIDEMVKYYVEDYSNGEIDLNKVISDDVSLCYHEAGTCYLNFACLSASYKCVKYLVSKGALGLYIEIYDCTNPIIPFVTPAIISFLMNDLKLFKLVKDVKTLSLRGTIFESDKLDLHNLFYIIKDLEFAEYLIKNRSEYIRDFPCCVSLTCEKYNMLTYINENRDIYRLLLKYA